MSLFTDLSRVYFGSLACAPSTDQFLQLLIEGQALAAPKIGTGAGAVDDVDAGLSDPLFLLAPIHAEAAGCQGVYVLAVEAHEPRRVGQQLLPQVRSLRLGRRRQQVVGAGGDVLEEARQPDPVSEDLPILLRSELAGRKPRLVKQKPESVRWPGVIVPARCGG